MTVSDAESLRQLEISRRCWERFTALLLEPGAHPWWDAVVVTAGSLRQAGLFEQEIRLRQEKGCLPPNCVYLVAADGDGPPLGNGGATLNALRVMAVRLGSSSGMPMDSLEAWWQRVRVLVIHGGGESRRLPQYSLPGKLFSAVPSRRPGVWPSSVFDELLAASADWAARMDSGLLVASGDVILSFDAQEMDFSRPGVTGVAIVEPASRAAEHGVYVADERGRVYAYLQKPSLADVRAAGGLLPGERVALDSGLLRFDAETAARLSALAGVPLSGDGVETGTGILKQGQPPLNLYGQLARALTGEWDPEEAAGSGWEPLAAALHNTPFWCCLAEGEFLHVGTTSHYRRLFQGDSDFSRLQRARQSVGVVSPEGLQCAGLLVDSIVEGGGEIQSGAVLLECRLAGPLRVGRGAILHGLTEIPGVVEVPEDTVIHQVPVLMGDGSGGWVIRTYGVVDDPNVPLGSGATWFGRPVEDQLEALGLEAHDVWPDIQPEDRRLWNARLFPAGPLALAWSACRWMLGYGGGFDAAAWRAAPRMSLATSAQYADLHRLEEERSRRHRRRWVISAAGLARSGADVRPLLAHSPGTEPLVEAAQLLESEAARLLTAAPTESASRYYQASQFYGQAGFTERAEASREAAYAAVRSAVDAGVYEDAFGRSKPHWVRGAAAVSAPARIDFGGGWSDTPPFCLDWGGTVLNMAVTLEGACPVRTEVKVIPEPEVRLISGETGESAVLTSAEEVYALCEPGDTFSIPRIALQMAGLPPAGQTLRSCLEKRGGGLEIRTAVTLPVGSGLGASSILAATLLSALARVMGLALGPDALSDEVMRLEQKLTSGGGWQDQVGGIHPGVKLVHSGPGFRQRLRVQMIELSPVRQEEFSRRFLLYYTGIRRIAKQLLAQIVGSYLAREAATVQVLHSIKTLAMEMAHAMREGDWDYLGQLMNRHWELNQMLDPHTTSAPINALLETMRPYLSGAKLAGAGGGGFLMLLARDEQAAQELRRRFGAAAPGARFCDYAIAPHGLGEH